MIIKYSPAFLKNFKKVDVRIRKSFKEKILLFAKNPNDSQLNNHELTKEWQGHRSIDVTVDYRAVYKKETLGKDKAAHFVILGTHDQLYKKNQDS